MKAKVKETCKLNTVQAFGGLEYNRYEWAAVPTGFEADALRHPLLEVLDDTPVPVDLGKLKFNELREMARAKGKYQTGMKKADLVAVLET
jgi:hypothetical protein